jgi:hypothetical protein
MKLTPQQLQEFDERGYLFLAECFSEEEVAALRSEADKIHASNRQEVWREKSGAPRTAFAAHTYNEAFRLLGAHPRLIGPVEQRLVQRWFGCGDRFRRGNGFESDDDLRDLRLGVPARIALARGLRRLDTEPCHVECG